MTSLGEGRDIIVARLSRVGRWLRYQRYLRLLPPARMEPANDRFWSLIDRHGSVVRVAAGFRFTEGPVWRAESASLLFSDIPANRILEYRAGTGVRVFREPSGHANGLTLDTSGRLVACEHGNRRVTLTETDGSMTALAARFRGKRLNSPNDVVVTRSGTILFTDPPYGINPEEQELDFQGVYRVTPTGELEVLIDEMYRPNGLALAPDESRLFVTDSGHRFIRVYDVRSDGTVSNGRLFVDMNTAERGVPDGLKLDGDGNIFSTGPGGVWILDPDGVHLGTIRLHEQPSNCAWGGPDGTTLYITAVTSVYRIETKVNPPLSGTGPALMTG